MFARVMHIHSKPGKIDQVVALYQESVIPALKQQKGFCKTLLLTDAASGNGMSITFWESESDQRHSETNGFLREQIGKVIPLLAAPPVREGFVAIEQI